MRRFAAVILGCVVVVLVAGAGVAAGAEIPPQPVQVDGVSALMYDDAAKGVAIGDEANAPAVVVDAHQAVLAETGIYDDSPSFVAPTSLVKIPSPSNTKLQNYVDQLFKHANQPGRIGDGTTMAALPSELAAGAGPHIQKATEIRNGLSRWLTTSAGQNASAADRAIAQDLFDQLDELLP